MSNQVGHLFGEALDQAKAIHKLKNKSAYCPQFARFKLQFINRDGTTSIPYFSYDTYKGVGGKNITDENAGYAKLLKYLNKRRYEDSYVVATIWANITPDLRTFIDGKLNKNYDFIVTKHVKGQREFVHECLKFRHGRLDVDLFKSSVFTPQNANR